MIHPKVERALQFSPSSHPTKVSDLIADYLANLGIEHTFVLTGGCAVHMIESISKRGYTQVIPMQHEQSAAMAADCYSRLGDSLGVAVTTSGPGATNLLTGVCCSFYDSVPVLLFTGQVNADQLKNNSQSRQIGFQETDVVSIFKSVTKSAVQVVKASTILKELDRAIFNCFSGRQGPCLIDICDDVQRTFVIPSELERFKINEDEERFNWNLEESLFYKIKEIVSKKKRPIFIFGAGIRSARAINEALSLSTKYNIPYLLTWGAYDYVPEDNQLFAGTFGVTSGRAGNFVAQNADCIIAIGTRLDTHEIGNKKELFAPHASKIVVDIDKSELDKFEESGLDILLPLVCDAKDFIIACIESNVLENTDIEVEWLEFIDEAKSEFISCTKADESQISRVNPYYFFKILGEECAETATIVTDCGSNLIWTMQGLGIKSASQRVISAWNHSPMGYSLPASIGAGLLSGGNETICVTGDGGLQINVQELATIERWKIPIKIFVMNNHGHGIIQGTQDQWLKGSHVAANYQGGLPDPDYSRIACAYNLPTIQIDSNIEVRDKIREALNSQGPVVCVVDLIEGPQIYPKLVVGAGIHDANPKLEDDLFAKYLRFVPENSKLRERN